MGNVPTVRLQHTRASDAISRTLDDIVGNDIVLASDVVSGLTAPGDLEALGVIALTRAAPPYGQPYKCTWYQGRYYCRFYRRGSWHLIWDQAEATEEMRDPVAEGPSVTEAEVKQLAKDNGVHEKWGCWRRGRSISEEQKLEAQATGFFDNK